MSFNINLILLFFHIIAITVFSLIALRLGKTAITAWIALLAVAANLFVLKQINLVGLNVTCSDSIAVGMILSLNLMQEFFGKAHAKKAIWIAFFISAAFLILTQFHLAYLPGDSDQTQHHFMALLAPMPRIIAASFVTFLIVQFLDIALFNYLKEKMNSKYLVLRSFISLSFSQTFDTALFSFLGLYGIVDAIFDVILLSLIVKFIAILVACPFVAFSKSLFKIFDRMICVLKSSINSQKFSGIFKNIAKNFCEFIEDFSSKAS